MHKFYSFSRLPISDGSWLTLDQNLRVTRFLSLKMPAGRLVSFVFPRSRENISVKLSSHYGAAPSSCFESASSLSFLKFLIESGNLVSLFLETSIKVSLVRLEKLSGSSVMRLLSDSSFFISLRLPKFLGRALIWLFLILSPSSLTKSHSSSGKAVSLLSLRLSLVMPLSLLTVSMFWRMFLLSCSLSRLGQLVVMNLMLVSLLSASSMFLTWSMPDLGPFIMMQLSSSRFSSISDRISFSFLQIPFTFWGMMQSFFALSIEMFTMSLPISSGISNTRYFLRNFFSASFLMSSSISVAFSSPFFSSLIPQTESIFLISSFLNLWILIFLDSIWMQTPQVGTNLSDSRLRLTIQVQASLTLAGWSFSNFSFKISGLSFQILHLPQIMCPQSGLAHFWWIHRQLVWEQAMLQSLHINGLLSYTQLCSLLYFLHPIGSATVSGVSFLIMQRYSTALGSRLIQTELSSVRGPNRVRPSSYTQWLNMLEHLMNLEVVDLTASCISQRQRSQKRTLMRMSLVPSFSLFLTRIIFITLGLAWLIDSSSWKILRISRSLELHLHLMMSPILKLSRSGGEVHRALLDSLVSQSSLETVRRPWMMRLRYRTMQQWRLLTVLKANLPQAFSMRSMCVKPSLSSSLRSSLACWSQLLSSTSFMKSSIFLRSSSMRSLRGSFIHMNMVLMLPPFSCTRTFSSRSRKQFFLVNFSQSSSHHLVRMRRMAGLLMVRCPLLISSSLNMGTFLLILRPMAQCVYSCTCAAYFSMLASLVLAVSRWISSCFSASVRLLKLSLEVAFIQPSLQTFSNNLLTKSQYSSQTVLPSCPFSSTAVMSQLRKRMMRSLQLPSSRQVNTTSHFCSRSFSRAQRLSMGRTLSSMALLTSLDSVSGYFFCMQGTMRCSMWSSMMRIWRSLSRYFLVSSTMLRRMPSEQKIFVCSQLMLSFDSEWNADENTWLHTSVIHSRSTSSSSSPSISLSGTSTTTARSRDSSSNSLPDRPDFFMSPSKSSSIWLYFCGSGLRKPELVPLRLSLWASLVGEGSRSPSPSPSSLGSLLKRTNLVFIVRI